MALSDIFNAGKIKNENEELKKKLEELNNLLTPDILDYK